MPTDLEDPNPIIIKQLEMRVANALRSNEELSGLVARLVARNQEYEAELDEYRMQAMGVAHE